MFLGRAFNRLRGYVRFEAEGGLSEQLLTLLREQNVFVWGVRRSEAGIYGYCFARDYARLRKPARRTGMRLRHTRKYGFPFFLHRHRFRFGIPIGLLLAVLLLRWLSGGIWVITVQGTEGELADSVRTALEPLGVEIGGRADALRPASIQLTALERIPDITWLAVNMRGCVAEIHVLERQVGEPEPNNILVSNLVAARDGVIVRTEVRQGQKQVRVGEGVTAGTLLVSGTVETGVGTLLKRAEGSVLAQTVRTHSVSVPLTQTLMLPGGEEVRQTELHFFGWTVPWYTTVRMSGPYSVSEQYAPLYVGTTELPLGVTQRVYTLLTPSVVTYTEQQADTLARQQLLLWEQDELAQAEIQDKTYTAKTENGVYTLTVTCACIEDIAMEQVVLTEDAGN